MTINYDQFYDQIMYAMDKGIEKSIKTRRDAVYANYDLPYDARLKAEALFERMEQFGERCRDQADFEEKFLTLTLNREFNNLFVEFTAYVRNPEETPSLQDQISHNVVSGVHSIIGHRTTMEISGAITQVLPEDLHRWRTRSIYNLPVLGSIISALNKLNIIQRLFKHNKRS